MQVSKWGNSLAIRLPAALVEALGIKEGDQIEITVSGSRVFRVDRDRRRDEALARLRNSKWKLPPGLSSIGKRRLSAKKPFLATNVLIYWKPHATSFTPKICTTGKPSRL
ncbi:MAG: AbrB/MazE/SpoVT family DNA-binding domain-containing protein [Acidobacteriaceae bacterium]|nr:AbrB/MazE/SpoVT family DNA-binding domain-containing protein [Acidobacteriaceae bacterium]